MLNLEDMKTDFQKLLNALSRWRSLLQGVKQEYFNIMTRRELDLLKEIEVDSLPAVFNRLEEIFVNIKQEGDQL